MEPLSSGDGLTDIQVHPSNFGKQRDLQPNCSKDALDKLFLSTFEAMHAAATIANALPTVHTPDTQSFDVSAVLSLFC